MNRYTITLHASNKRIGATGREFTITARTVPEATVIAKEKVAKELGPSRIKFYSIRKIN